jgi:hypothetical protein
MAYLVWIPFAQAVLHSPQGPQSPHTFSRNIPALFLSFVYLFVLNRDIQCSIINLDWCMTLRKALRKIYPHLRVLSLFSSRWNWDPPPPHPQANVPPVPVGGAPSLAGEGVGMSQFRRGDMRVVLCIFMYFVHLMYCAYACSMLPSGFFRYFFRISTFSPFQPWTVDTH